VLGVEYADIQVSAEQVVPIRFTFSGWLKIVGKAMILPSV
jgi:hypothetical protein